MKRLGILTILIITALGLGAAPLYAQFDGGPGGGWGLGESSAAAPNSITASADIKIIRAGQTISSIAGDANTVSVTLASAYPNNNLKVGQKIVISGTTNYNGAFTIATVTDQSNFSYAQAGSRATETAGAAGGDYTSLSGWEAGVQGTLTAVQTAECYNDWASGLSDNLTISGSTTTSAYYMKITVPVSERNTGTADTGFKIAGTVTIGDSYAAIEDVEATGLVTISSPAVVTTAGNMLFTGGLAVASGATLNADSSNMTIAGDFTPAGTFNAQNAIIKFTGATVDFTTAGSVFNTERASLVFSGVSTWKNIAGANQKYNTVEFVSCTTNIVGTPYIKNKLILDMGAGGKLNGSTIYLEGDLVCLSGAADGTSLISMSGISNKYGHISGPETGPGGILPALWIERGSSMIIFAGTLTLQDVTFKELNVQFRGGYTYTIVAGKTINCVFSDGGRTLKFLGTSAYNMVRLRSSIPGTRWNLTVSPTYASNIIPTYTDVQDCNASTTITASASANVNSGNNVNWNFGTGNFTWIADTAKDWSDSTAWAGGSAPTADGLGCIYFTGAHNGDCTLSANVSVSSIISSGYTGTLSTSASNHNINITASSLSPGLRWHSGTLKANGSTITVRGNLDLRGGTFTPDTSTLELVKSPANYYSQIESDIPNFNIFNIYTGFYIKSGSTITVGSASALNFIGNNLPGTTTADTWRGPIFLMGASTPQQWNIDNSAAGSTVTAIYTAVRDSKAFNSTNKINAASSVDWGNNVNWLFGSAPVSQASVTPASFVAGASGKVTAVFNIQSNLPGDCAIEITFPSGFTFGSVTILPGSLDGALSAAVAGQKVIITRTGGSAITADWGSPATLTVALDNITNPSSTGTTGTYTITTKTYPAGAIIHDGPGIAGSVIVANPLSSLSWAGGATGTVGTAQNITWTSSATSKPASVNIKYSTDSGVTYPNLIAKVTNNTGSNSYSWKPLSVLGPNVRIKVEDAANAQVFVASASDIAIAAPVMTITSPTAVTEWATDEWHTITWTPNSTTNPAITRVKLEYSYDGGITWATRHDSLPNTGEYAWNMTDILPSPTMKFRVTGLPAVTGITYTGAAAGKVATPPTGLGAYLTSGNKVLVIDIATNFLAGNILTITGLKFNNFAAAASIGQLTLDINNDGTADATDDRSIMINYNSAYSGGYGDGWSYSGCTN